MTRGTGQGVRRVMRAFPRWPLIAFFAIFLIYWLKCLFGWNLSASHGLSGFFPFKYLQESVVIVPAQAGLLFTDSFGYFRIRHNWHLWMRQPGHVKAAYDRSAGEGARYLVITSDNETDWGYVHQKYIKVRKGDVFTFSCLAAMTGENIQAHIRAAAFDENRKVISWSYAAADIPSNKQWHEVSGTFMVSGAKVSYIQLGLAGRGRGEFRFDDVKLAVERLARLSSN